MGDHSPFNNRNISLHFFCSGMSGFGCLRCLISGADLRSNRFNPNQLFIYPTILCHSGINIFSPRHSFGEREKLAGQYEFYKKCVNQTWIILLDIVRRKSWNILIGMCSFIFRILFVAGFFIIEEIISLKEPMISTRNLIVTYLLKMPSIPGGFFNLSDRRISA